MATAMGLTEAEAADAADLSPIERRVFVSLKPMFPALTSEIIKNSIRHPENRRMPALNEPTLLDNCLNDLLDLRTHTQSTTLESTDGFQQLPILSDSDEDLPNSNVSGDIYRLPPPLQPSPVRAHPLAKVIEGPWDPWTAQRHQQHTNAHVPVNSSASASATAEAEVQYSSPGGILSPGLGNSPPGTTFKSPVASPAMNKMRHNMQKVFQTPEFVGRRTKDVPAWSLPINNNDMQAKNKSVGAETQEERDSIKSEIFGIIGEADNFMQKLRRQSEAASFNSLDKTPLGAIVKRGVVHSTPIAAAAGSAQAVTDAIRGENTLDAIVVDDSQEQLPDLDPSEFSVYQTPDTKAHGIDLGEENNPETDPLENLQRVLDDVSGIADVVEEIPGLLREEDNLILPNLAPNPAIAALQDPQMPLDPGNNPAYLDPVQIPGPMNPDIEVGPRIEARLEEGNAEPPNVWAEPVIPVLPLDFNLGADFEHPGAVLVPNHVHPDPVLPPDIIHPDPVLAPEPVHPDPVLAPEPVHPDPVLAPEPVHPDPVLAPEPVHPDPVLAPDPVHPNRNPEPLAAAQPGAGNLRIDPEPVNPVQAPAPLDKSVIIVEPVQPAPVIRDPLQDDIDTVCCLFPDVDPAYVMNTLRDSDHGAHAVEILCNNLIESADYPRRPKPTPEDIPAAAGSAAGNNSASASASKKPHIDYYSTQEDETLSPEYKDQSIDLLRADFRYVPMKDLRAVARYHNHHHAPTYMCLLEGLKKGGVCTQRNTAPGCFRGPEVCLPTSVKEVTLDITTGDGSLQHTIKFLKSGRPGRYTYSTLTSRLQDEMEFIHNDCNSKAVAADEVVAMEVNAAEYADEGQTIECQCCYGDFAFESMVQCYEGHLFCEECLKRYAEESVYGQGKSILGCMSEGCEASYPQSQMQKAVPDNVLQKFAERQQEEALNLADIEGLLKCPHCDFRAILPPGDKVFRCQNQECLKETCRNCKEDWGEHFGKPCSEVEKKDETKLRKEFEEKMTEAKMRECVGCKAKFVKSDGCNKMTCRCGAKMCYICRIPKIDYNHFCNHPREPGQGCKTCSACSLWTKPDEDDERAIAEVRREAEAARAAQGFTEKRMIGAPPDEPQLKRPRLEGAAAAPPIVAPVPMARVINAVNAVVDDLHIQHQQRQQQQPQQQHRQQHWHHNRHEERVHHHHRQPNHHQERVQQHQHRQRQAQRDREEERRLLVRQMRDQVAQMNEIQVRMQQHQLPQQPQPMPALPVLPQNFHPPPGLNFPPQRF